MFWYITIPVIIIIITIIYIIYCYFRSGKEKTLLTVGCFLLALIGFLCYIISSNVYKINHPNNIYKLKILSTNYDPNKYSRPVVWVQYNNQILPVRFDNPENWKRINVGDTILARGYDENYLRFYKYYNSEINKENLKRKEN